MNIEERISSNFLFDSVQFGQRLFHLENDLFSPVLCETCSKPTRFISRQQGCQKFCSSACAQKSQETGKKRDQTCIEKYGTAIPCKNQKIELSPTENA